MLGVYHANSRQLKRKYAIVAVWAFVWRSGCVMPLAWREFKLQMILEGVFYLHQKPSAKICSRSAVGVDVETERRRQAEWNRRQTQNKKKKYRLKLGNISPSKITEEFFCSSAQSGMRDPAGMVWQWPRYTRLDHPIRSIASQCITTVALLVGIDDSVQPIDLPQHNDRIYQSLTFVLHVFAEYWRTPCTKFRL